jgi:hypothetical protein
MAVSDHRTAALRALSHLRASRAAEVLAFDERAELDANLRRLERALEAPSEDPYANPVALETPADLNRELGALTRPPAPASPAARPPAAAPPPQQAARPPAPGPLQSIGGQTRQTLDAIDFASFVGGLIDGTFRSIVDSTARQLQEYALLVASIAKTVDDFARDSVTPNQVRDWFVARYPADLQLVLPAAGRNEPPRLIPRSDRSDAPSWLDRYGLGGRTFDAELTDGPLIEAGRRALAEERLQTLATMVLMGVSRIVINDGTIRARLQFHAKATEVARAEIAVQQGGQQVGIASRNVDLQTSAVAAVSTVNVNAQAAASIQADLLGEVQIQFRTETFPLERFADSRALTLINRHARWEEKAPAAPAPPATTPPDRGGTP